LSSDVSWRVRDFVAVQDGAMARDVCSGLIAQFDASVHAEPGRTGHGVAPEKKLSLDITLDHHAEWQEARRVILTTMRGLVTRYFAEHHLALIGAVSPTVRDPADGKLTTLSVERWSELGAPISDALSWRLYRFGTLNIQRYERGRGGYPHWHSEVFPQSQSTDALHRVLFVMVYLNDVEDGGATEFFYQGLAVQPQAGRAVIAPAGFTHSHRGCVPRSSDKYIATTWVMFRPGTELYAPSAATTARASPNADPG
jgi:hypothetical protein